MSEMERIAGKITEKKVEFIDTISGQAVREWGFSKKDVENCLRELAAYKGTGLTPEEINSLKNDIKTLEKTVNEYWAAGMEQESKLVEYAQAEQEGRLVVLPCKVGDKIYTLQEETKKIIECNVDSMNLSEELTMLISYDTDNLCYECKGCPFEHMTQSMPDGEYDCDGEWGQWCLTRKEFEEKFYLSEEQAKKALKEKENEK